MTEENPSGQNDVHDTSADAASSAADLQESGTGDGLNLGGPGGGDPEGEFEQSGVGAAAARSSRTTDHASGATADVTLPSAGDITDAGQSSQSPKKNPLTPSGLSLDTQLAAKHPEPNQQTQQRSPLSPHSTPSIEDVAQRDANLSPPVSPRTRNRGPSLRRSIFAKNFTPTKSTGTVGTVVELDNLAGSTSEAPRSKDTLGSWPTPHKLASSTSTSPIVHFDTDVNRSGSQMEKDFPATALPHYEKWASKNKTISRRVLSRVKEIKENVRKTILRIHDLPPSKDGRHVSLDLSRRKALIDERRGREYRNNTIRSTRHTLYNFLPRQLFFQFYKLANFYFLCVSILQMIPGLSTTGTYTTIVPLLFFVGISIAKEGYDDLRRYRLDKAENRRMASVLHAYKPVEVATNATGTTAPVTVDGLYHWATIKWENVKVGDVVKLGRDDASPADIVVLQASGTEDLAYIETMALDGETNLKTKQPPQPLARACQTPEDIVKCTADVVAEDPNLDLYNFEGKLSVNDETVPLTNQEIIYRGSILRNTKDVTGMVLYTGEECKIRMNANKNPRIKAPALQFAVNRVVVIIVIFVVVLAIFNTVAYQIWGERTEEKAWYLTNAGVAFFPILASFIILFNTMIPLSLYVSLEIIKLCQMLLLNDIDMYDEQSNTPMEARTSTINEELGQVNYIFSDKTGTLTNNSMRFRKLTVAGTAWLHDTDLQQHEITKMAGRLNKSPRISKGKQPARRSDINGPSSPKIGHDHLRRPSASTVGRSSSVTSLWTSSARRRGNQKVLNTRELLEYIQQRPHTPFARKAHFFILSIAICHTCIPETKQNGDISYQAASPDELALVQAAQELGYVVIDRQSGVLTIKTMPHGPDSEAKVERYEVLDVIDFSSARKRMSAVVRMPDHKICVFCKGADSVIMQLLRLSQLANSKAAEIEQRNSRRQTLEAQHAIRRASEARSRKNSLAKRSLSLHRPSVGGIGRLSMSAKHLQPIRDEIDQWLSDRERDGDPLSTDNEAPYNSPRPSEPLSAQHGRASYSLDGRRSMHADQIADIVDESMVTDDPIVFERCLQHINDFATEGLRTLVYGHRYLEEDEYRGWKKLYHEATTSLVDRQEKVEKAGAMIEQGFELAGATAIEDKLQDGVPETIDKLRRAGIKLWMLTGDKRETAINIGHSCRLIKDYSTITILDRDLGDVDQRMAAAIVSLNDGCVAHSVIVIDGQTLGEVNAQEPLRKLFLSLTILVDTVICCRASPSQKASLVHSIRRKVNHAVTLAIGDGANDIAMIQEAHVGIGITGKEGLQAARTSDYSIAQFRFLTKLLFVHGRWNYVRTCKYTLGTFWKELLFYLTQALFQRYAGYTGTSLYESWSLSMFNTLFTSLPVIFMGIFEQDLSACTLMAVPELYQTEGPRNAGFNIPLYLGWVFMASSNAVIVFFIMLGLYGQALFTLDNGLFAMGALSYTSCVIIIAMKMQFWELHNKNIMAAIALFLSIGGWFLWNMILSATYHNNVIYNVKDGFLDRFGRNSLWWLTIVLILTACWAFEVGIKTAKYALMPSDADCFRELEKDEIIRQRFASASGIGGEPFHDDDLDTSVALQRVRSPEEERRRETEVQAILDRPRHMRVTSGNDASTDHPESIRGRTTLEEDSMTREQKVSFAIAQRDFANDNDADDSNGKQKARRRSFEVSEMLRRGFGTVRRSSEMG